MPFGTWGCPTTCWYSPPARVRNGSSQTATQLQEGDHLLMVDPKEAVKEWRGKIDVEDGGD